MMIKDTVFGADASAANQFAPYLSMISSLAGGKPPAQAAQKSQPDVQTQLASMQRTQQYLVFGALGVGVLGMLYLLLKK